MYHTATEAHVPKFIEYIIFSFTVFLNHIVFTFKSVEIVYTDCQLSRNFTHHIYILAADLPWPLLIYTSMIHLLYKEYC